MKRFLIVNYFLPVILMLFGFFYAWSALPSDSNFVIYFGRPYDAVGYVIENWVGLITAAVICTLTAVLSLILTTVLSIALLTIGLRYENGVKAIENVVAISQAVPITAIVLLVYVVEISILSMFGYMYVDVMSIIFYIPPVVCSLLFPPLVNGAKAIRSIQIELKQLIKIWNPPRSACIKYIYLYKIIPDVLSGVRTSSTWAVGATLIVEQLVPCRPIDGVTPLGVLLAKSFSQVNGQASVIFLVATFLGVGVYLLTLYIQRKIEEMLLGADKLADDNYKFS